MMVTVAKEGSTIVTPAFGSNATSKVSAVSRLKSSIIVI